MIEQLLSELYVSAQNLQNHWAMRTNPFWGYYRKENNIFAVASTLFILKELENKLPKEYYSSIKKEVSPLYQNYRNKDGRDTYNFYTTRPSGHFPNGYFMKNWDHFRLPDDADDTALIYFTLEKEKVEVAQLKELTESFAETKPDGRLIYNTWYGKNMPKEQDVCTLLNLMYLFHYYKLPLTKIDKDTFLFLKEGTKLIESHPFKLARHYANAPLIVYYYARFLANFPDTDLEECRNLIISLGHRLLQKEKVYMNRVILASSLLKLGSPTKEVIDLQKIDFKGFYTFIAAPLAPFQNWFSKYLAGKTPFQMFYNSEMHNKALILEYIYLSQTTH